MSDPFTPGIGQILSADIAVPEHDREVRFYAQVLTTGEHPLWREDLMNNAGTPIIGLVSVYRIMRNFRFNGCLTFKSPMFRPAPGEPWNWEGLS